MDVGWRPYRGGVLQADVAVVGAGPAGVAAGIVLARAGRDVVVIDKATFPRDKTCGDGLTTGALRELEALGFDPASVPSWQRVHDVWIGAPGRDAVRYPLPPGPGTYAAVAPRLELDAALVDLARAAGVRVEEGRTLVAAAATAGCVRLDVEGLGGVEVASVIGADGTWSPLRRLLGLGTPGYRGEWYALRQYLRGVAPAAAADLFVWFEPDILPGYIWSFPLPDGRANVGYGVERGGRVPVGDLAARWPELLARPRVREVLGPDAAPEGPPRAWPIPARVDRVPLTDPTGRALFVGDAAAASDALTGEGIGQALLTGRLAAEAVLAGPTPSDAGPAYAAAVGRELVPDARASRALVRVLRHEHGARGAVRISGATGWTRRNFARWLFEDYPRAWLATPRRWSRHSFTGPGAWVDDGSPRADGAAASRPV